MFLNSLFNGHIKPYYECWPFFCGKSALAAIPEERMLDEMLTTGLLNFFFTGLLLAGLPEPLMGEGRVNLEASFSF